jgi:hypothetical protein
LCKNNKILIQLLLQFPHILTQSRHKWTLTRKCAAAGYTTKKRDERVLISDVVNIVVLSLNLL